MPLHAPLLHGAVVWIDEAASRASSQHSTPGIDILWQASSSKTGPFLRGTVVDVAVGYEIWSDMIMGYLCLSLYGNSPWKPWPSLKLTKGASMPCHNTGFFMCHLFNEICQLLRIQISKKFRICTLQSCHVTSGGLNRWHEKSLLDEHLPSSKCCKVDSKDAILSQHDTMSQSSQGRPCSRDAWADAKALDIQGTKQGPIHRNVRL